MATKIKSKKIPDVIQLGDLIFAVNDSLTTAKLTQKFHEAIEEGEEDYRVIGYYDADSQTIFLAKDLGEKRKFRTLIHEIAEGINEVCELGLEQNHTKIVALENMLISFITRNKGLIESMWKEFNVRTSD